MEKTPLGHHSTLTVPHFADNDVVYDASDDLLLKNIPNASPEAVKFVDAIGRYHACRLMNVFS
jgi:hypothetical protein